jgi:hypothetical protein
MSVTARGSCVALVFAAVSLFAPMDVAAQAPAPPTDERCLAAYEQGQRLRLKHALIEARAELLLCARAPCPENFRPECLTWFDEVDKLVPSVVIHVDGDPAATDVRVSIDGVVVAERLDGTPIEVDPGEHVFRFERKGRPADEHLVLINAGQKARVLTVAGAPSARSPSAASTTPWFFAGLGALAFGSFTYFGVTGLSRRDDLDRCTPYCEQGDIDSVRNRFIAADVSLAISAVSFGVAVYSYLRSRRASGAAMRVEASGGPSAGYIGVTGAF